MWQRIGKKTREAILASAACAQERNERDISTVHLLWGLTEDLEDTPHLILEGLGVSGESVRAAINTMDFSERTSDAPEPSLTLEARQAVDWAYRLARDMNDHEIYGEHLLLSFLRQPVSCDAGRALSGQNVTYMQAAAALMAVQPWRSVAPPGEQIPGMRLRRFKKRARNAKATLLRWIYFSAHYRSRPFAPYFLHRNRVLDNPYPLFTRLRRSPCHWDPMVKQWFVTGYKEAAGALQDQRFSHQAYELPPLPPLVEREFASLNSNIGMEMLFLDAPRHTRLRALVSKQFTPRVIARMEEHIQEATDSLLENPAKIGRLEVVSELASPLPSTVVALMLGVSEDESDAFRKWSEDFSTYIANQTTLAQDFDAYNSLHQLKPYFRREIARKRAAPQDDLMTLFIQAEDQGDSLSEEEIISNCLLLLAAGHETTSHLIGNGLLALLRHPEQLKRLQESPELVPSAVEEMLRYDPPIQWTSRNIKEPFEWNGRRFETGQMVSIALAAANRDPLQFPNPDRFDITRTENRHLAFGYGPHFCLGSALARLEAQVVFRTLIKQFPNIRLENRKVEWRRNFTFRGLKSLPVLLK